MKTLSKVFLGISYGCLLFDLLLFAFFSIVYLVFYIFGAIYLGTGNTVPFFPTEVADFIQQYGYVYIFVGLLPFAGFLLGYVVIGIPFGMTKAAMKRAKHNEKYVGLMIAASILNFMFLHGVFSSIFGLLAGLTDL